MPITYHCDQCGKEETDMSGWYLVRVSLLYESPDAPTPPGGTVLEDTQTDRIFDSKGCQSQWLAAHDLT